MERVEQPGDGVEGLAGAITSAQNPRFKALKKLADSADERRTAGMTLLDGEHLLDALLQAGGMPRQLLVSDPALTVKWQRRCPSVPVLQLSPTLLGALAPVKTPTGVMAVMDIPHPPHPPAPHFSIMLEHIQDPGNVGAMLRSAAAGGVDTVFLSPGCADVWSPKVLRGGMGAHFVLRLVEKADLSAWVHRLPAKVVATALDAQQSLYDLDLQDAVSFVFGNEGGGLSPELLTHISHRVQIPMPGNMESLNAAAALAVCVFERVRQTVAR